MRFFPALLAMAALGLSTPSEAQNVAASPNYGEITLAAGFTPDPAVVSLVAGGLTNAATLGDNCAGFISRRPDVRVNYTAGSAPLIISVASEADTTLIIHGPDGAWHCDDDSGVNGQNPSIRWAAPASGVYTIWVGSYREGTNSQARLHVSEVRSQ